MPFSISIQISFGYFLQIVKQQTVNTCKIGYNWIFITRNFLKMDQKRYLKGPKNGPIWSLRIQMFVFALEYAEEHLKLVKKLWHNVNEKIRLKIVRDRPQITFVTLYRFCLLSEKKHPWRYTVLDSLSQVVFAQYQ